MNAATTEDELRMYLQKTLKLNTENTETMKIKLKPAYGSTQIAVIDTDQGIGDKILNLRKIYAGLAPARVVEWVEVERCFRCWGYGHKLSECKEEDRKERCLNCGLAGHFIKECQEKMHCPFCNKAGHRAGTAKCETFLEARRKIAQKSEKERKYRSKESEVEKEENDGRKTPIRAFRRRQRRKDRYREGREEKRGGATVLRKSSGAGLLHRGKREARKRRSNEENRNEPQQCGKKAENKRAERVEGAV